MNRVQKLEQALFQTLLNIQWLLNLNHLGEKIIPELEVEIEQAIKEAKDLLTNE